MQNKNWPVWTYEEVLAQFSRSEWGTWINIGTPGIRPFTKDELAHPERFDKKDLEGNRITPKADEWLCRGDHNNYWTTEAEHVQKYRTLVNPNEPPDKEGFRRYRIKNPKPILAIILFDPFILRRSENDFWESQPDGGVITWNGEIGEECDMRVNTIPIFEATYRYKV